MFLSLPHSDLSVVRRVTGDSRRGTSSTSGVVTLRTLSYPGVGRRSVGLTGTTTGTLCY